VLPMHPLTTHSHRRPTEPRDWYIYWR
jgi:hypothetical protein